MKRFRQNFARPASWILSLLSVAFATIPATAQESGTPGQVSETICTFDISSLHHSKTFRERITRLAKEEADEHGLGEKHLAELLQELMDYRILVIDTVRTVVVDGVETKEFAHGNAPKVVLYRKRGEYEPQPDKPLAERVIPQLTAEIAWYWKKNNVTKTSKQFVMQLHVYGLPGAGWRESKHQHRWGVSDVPIIKIAADGSSGIGFVGE